MENKKDNTFPHFMNNNNLLKCKKAQAAMEFLMTYGWALLVVIIAVGVLAWLGVFNPNKYISDSCMLSSPLSCDEFVVSKAVPPATTGTVKIAVSNGAGDKITIIKVHSDQCTVDFSTSTEVPEGAKSTALTLTGCTVSDRFKGSIVVTYKKGASGVLDLVSSGTIASKAS